MRKVGYFVALLAGTFALLFSLGWFDGRQLASICIFSTFIFGTLLFGEFRLAFAFGGIALLLALNLMDVPQFVESANLKVIIFLVGMFLVIGYLEERGRGLDAGAARQQRRRLAAIGEWRPRR